MDGFVSAMDVNSQDTVKKVLQNIVEFPSEPKFRTLKKDNKVVAEKICASPNAVTLLLALGFEDCGATYQCPEYANYEQIGEVVDLLECLIASRGVNAVPGANAVACASPPANELDSHLKAVRDPKNGGAVAVFRRDRNEKLRVAQQSQLEEVRAARAGQHFVGSAAVGSPAAGSAAVATSGPPIPQRVLVATADIKKKPVKTARDFESRSRKEQETQKASASLQELRQQQKERYEGESKQVVNYPRAMPLQQKPNLRYDFGCGLARCGCCKSWPHRNRGCESCGTRVCADCSRKQSHTCNGASMRA